MNPEFHVLAARLNRYTVDLWEKGIFPGHIYVGTTDYALLRHLEQQFTPDYRCVRWMGPLGVSDLYERKWVPPGQFAYESIRTFPPKALSPDRRQRLLERLREYRLEDDLEVTP